ncbi:hypothetical protein D9Q98_001771 [Chlorella vulgaris]|uniref:Uncharacterized protein n=1 Tax=Chlorella vulgaris TaxID=3077 RepID=A0A9D4TV72_CHLVU|nr:hypothetical protein D9Q98_001771 [Chlorella vulgaris]
MGGGPFPCYVHRKEAVCAEGYRPQANLGKDGYSDETQLQTLVREAVEYQARVAEIMAEIEATGTYTHTYDELQHGARCAWRNAPKCANRKFWEELKLVDARDASSPSEMFASCLEVLERATLSCVTTCNIAVFRPQTPGSKDGPRVWNNQLVRYAGFRQADGSVVGDPAEADFTEMVTTHFGWQPPQGSDPRFTLLPVLLQAHADEAPECFTLPPQYVIIVPIRHPDNEAISNLGLQWYAVPAVSCLDLSVGGLTYTACPFNGWYTDTEIVRNITDEGRLDMCRPVARALGLDTKNEASLWRDRAIVEVDVAVLHSFREAGMGMVDHTTLMQQFWKWYNRELLRRGYSPGNWKWIISPVSPTATKCYLHLNKMTEYTLKPGYWYGAGWRHHKARWEAEHGRLGSGPAPGSMSRRSAASGAANGTITAMLQLGGGAGSAKVVILYASVTGNTEEYAVALANTLKGCLPATVMNMEDFESDSWAGAIADAALVVIATSTYGPGAPPRAAAKFVQWLQGGGAGGGDDARECFKDKPFCVLGLGSSCYPRFCAAADMMHSLLLAAGAKALLPVCKADALAGEEMTVWTWVKRLGEEAVGEGWMDSRAESDLVKRLPMSEGSKPPPFVAEWRLVSISGEGLEAARERRCHWATVLEASEQLPEPSEGTSTKLIRLDIGTVSCGNYYAGDELCVWAENEAGLVERFGQQLGIADLDEMFLLQAISKEGDEDGALGAEERYPLPNTFRTILARHVGLSETIGYAAIAALSGCAPGDMELARLADNYGEYQTWASTTLPRWCDIFDLFPTLLLRLPLAMFFQLAPALKPRYYSISSSSAVTPSEVAVTVGLLAYKLPSGQQRTGFCSSYLTSLRPGDRVRFKLISQPAFRQPLNLEAPVVWVAAGTGLAPFRGFWEERLLRLQQGQPLGPAMLVFGCRSTEKDFIYQERIDEMLKAGSVTRLLTALSREAGVRKAYVQDVVARQAKMLQPLLCHPRCHVYICGSSNMAQEVNVALGKVAGKPVIEAMAMEGRYHEDVFGITIINHAAAVAAAQGQAAIKALAGADLPTVLARLDAGLPIDGVDETGSSLLHHAARRGRTDLVSVLISRRAPLNTANKLGLTPLAEAVVAGHTQLAVVMQAQGALRASRLHISFYPLHAAVMNEDVGQVTELLAQGQDPNQTDFFSVASLHVAVALGNIALVKVLLDGGANPNVSSALGTMPLQLAVAHGKTEVAALLTEAGASIKPAHITSGAASGAADPTAGGELAGAGVTAEDIALVKASWAFVTGEANPAHSDEAVETFGRDLFLALFDAYPTTLELFPFKGPDGKPIDHELRRHGKVVALAIGEVISLLTHTDSLRRYLSDIIERHVKYGVVLMHYDVVLGTIAAFVQSVLPKKRLEVEELAAWNRVLGVIKTAAEAFYAELEAKGAAN